MPIARCDLLLFVATDTEEEALRTAASEFALPFKEIEGKFGTYFDLGQLGLNRVFAVRTSVGPFSYAGSASRAIYAKSETAATGVISLGMAFGVDPKTQDLGDVLVSTSILPYENRNVHSDNGLPKYRYNRVVAHPAKGSLRTLLERGRDAKERQFQVHFGAMLSGGTHIACRAYRDHLVLACSSKAEQIIGGEMEGTGFLSLSDGNSPIWIIVKGIADFADEERAKVIKSNRSTACLNAARFVLDVLQNERISQISTDIGDVDV